MPSYPMENENKQPSSQAVLVCVIFHDTCSNPGVVLWFPECPVFPFIAFRPCYMVCFYWLVLVASPLWEFILQWKHSVSCLVDQQFPEAHMGPGEGHPPEGSLDPSLSLCISHLLPSLVPNFQAHIKSSLPTSFANFQPSAHAKTNLCLSPSWYS